MKLKDLFFEQTYGKESLEEKILSEKRKDEEKFILESVDDDFGIIRYSNIIKRSIDLAEEELGKESDILNSFNNIIECLELLEEKKMESGIYPKVFTRIKLDDVRDSFEFIQEEVSNIKTFNKLKNSKVIDALVYSKLAIGFFSRESMNESFIVEETDNEFLKNLMDSKIEFINEII